VERLKKFKISSRVNLTRIGINRQKVVKGDKEAEVKSFELRMCGSTCTCEHVDKGHRGETW